MHNDTPDAPDDDAPAAPAQTPVETIGYKRPPKANQFKPGQSGNKGGRPPGTKNFKTAFETELASMVKVTENGKSRKISKRVAIVKQAVNKAAAGDPKALPIVLSEARFHESQSEPTAVPTEITDARDKAVLSDLMRRLSAMPTPLQSTNSPDAIAAPDAENSTQPKTEN